MATCAAVVCAEDAAVETTADVSASVQANVASTYTGLKKDADGVWRYYTNGVFDNTKTGVVMYGEGWFYVTDGMLDPAFVGLVPYNGGVFYVTAGQMRWDYNGLALYNGNWFVIKEGMLHTGFNSLYSYNKELFLFTAGTMCIDYTGYQTLDGVTYYIAAGQVYSSNKVFNNGSIAENTCPICGRSLVNGQCDVIDTYGYGWSVYNKATDSVYIVCDSCQQAWPMTVFPDAYEFGNVHGRPLIQRIP